VSFRVALRSTCWALAIGGDSQCRSVLRPLHLESLQCSLSKFAVAVAQMMYAPFFCLILSQICNCFLFAAICSD